MVDRKVTVYFDGLCHLCSREISHYRKMKGSEQLAFVDITHPDFRPEKEGLDPERVHREMHVRKADGSLAIGVDAFIAIWEVLPRYHVAARLGRSSVPNLFLRAGYQVFAAVRPFLPRRSAECSESPYCQIPKK